MQALHFLQTLSMLTLRTRVRIGASGVGISPIHQACKSSSADDTRYTIID